MNGFCPMVPHYIAAFMYCQRDGKNEWIIRNDTLNNSYFYFPCAPLYFNKSIYEKYC